MAFGEIVSADLRVTDESGTIRPERQFLNYHERFIEESWRDSLY